MMHLKILLPNFINKMKIPSCINQTKFPIFSVHFWGNKKREKRVTLVLFELKLFNTIAHYHHHQQQQSL